MAYKIVNKLTKEDTKPWPWISLDQTWLDELAEVIFVILPKHMQNSDTTMQQKLEWMAAQSTPTTLTIEHVYDSQGEANQYVLAVYEMVMENRPKLERWATEVGAVNVQHFFNIEEV